jgi:hypothetical protein
MVVILTLDGDDQLGDDWEDFGSTLFQHIEDSLDGEETVGVLLLSNTLEKDREVVVVVELLDLYLPVDLKLGTVLDGYRQISSVVKAAEL